MSNATLPLEMAMEYRRWAKGQGKQLPEGITHEMLKHARAVIHQSGPRTGDLNDIAKLMLEINGAEAFKEKPENG